jgi:hypothetical protein
VAVAGLDAVFGLLPDACADSGSDRFLRDTQAAGWTPNDHAVHGGQMVCTWYDAGDSPSTGSPATGSWPYSMRRWLEDHAVRACMAVLGVLGTGIARFVGGAR